MKLLADLWPLLIVVGFVFAVYAFVRLIRRFSPGAVSAGPKTPPDSLINSKTETADDLRKIESRLDTRPESLIERIEGSCAQLGVSVVGIPPGTPPEQHIDALLRRLEDHLGLDFAQQVIYGEPLATNEGTTT